ncbi:conserved hypothetical protein [Histoplasma capsulatum G186AR]|uniref:Uncharacterized protein n=2 Tax=Ajellomyces capsulatus TaxID=5037 RepID=C0NW17_AJECG|nr:uncharacterized protein HCBG_07347 [Histoplasma capsulatum G186AR]EEH04122.1 conserved hypothetical protein [Histoplasma capsulatum G186AR]KAG5299011.1 hypothetical protein I7I52_09174 [Histoplasma capsulatum]QSS68370.1 hypothetical protein I7I50_07753 [Histoplasma capsulatum G186AR]
MTLNSATSRSKPAVSEVAITSRWCNRALRPLTSTILRLEKHWKITRMGVPTLNHTTAFELSQESRTAAQTERLAPESESESTPDDPTWVPGGAVRKRIKHKYSARTASRSRVVVKSPETQKLQPGEFSIPTPLIHEKKRHHREAQEPNGVAGGNATIANSNEDSSLENSRPGPVRRRLSAYGWNSRKTWTDACNEYNEPSYVAIAQGIFQIWDTFLTMTAAEKSASVGARSLMHMALGATSTYIAREQEAVDNREDKDEKIDIANVIFTELESMYGTSNTGWKPLKSLVRLHGIRLVCDAIRKRWISPMIARQLALNSIDSSSYDAAQEIISALLSVTMRVEDPRHLDCSLFSARNFGVFHTLAAYVNKASHLSFFFRTVGSLLRCGIVPVEWIATESMKPFVTHAIRSISCEDHDCSASVSFIVNMALAASGSHTYCAMPASNSIAITDKLQECDEERWKLHSAHCDFLETSQARTNEHLETALNNSISSILGILCSAYIVRCSSRPPATPSSASSIQHILARLSDIVQRDIEGTSFHVTQDRSRSELLRMGHILMADFIITSNNVQPRTNQQAVDPPATRLLSTFEYFTRTLRSRKDLTASLSAFVTHISHCCGQVLSEDGFTHLKILTDALTGDKLQPYTTLRALLGKVAVDAALNFAESTLHPDHHSWAAHIQTRVTSYSNGPSGQDEIFSLTPSLALSKTGYIWEESIGEWITAGRPNGARRSFRTYQDQMSSLPDPLAELPDINDSDDARASRSSSTFSACSERYSSSITSSDITSPLWSRKRKRVVNPPNLDSRKHTRISYPLSPSAPRRRLPSRKARSWNFCIDERDTNDSEPLTFGRFTRSNITKTRDVTELNMTKARLSHQRTEIDRSFTNRVPVVEVRLRKPPYRHNTVEVVIIHNRNKYSNTKSSESAIQDDVISESDYSESVNDDYCRDHHDDNDGDDEDILARALPPRYLLRHKRTCTTRASEEVRPRTTAVTRLRTTRSSTSLRKQSISRAVNYDIVGSSDDELSFL